MYIYVCIYIYILLHTHTHYMYLFIIQSINSIKHLKENEKVFTRRRRGGEKLELLKNKKHKNVKCIYYI